MSEDRKSWTDFDFVLHDMERECKSIDEQLRRACDDLKDKMERTVRNVDEGMSVNSLGEVQGRGADVDRLCALRTERYQAVTRMKWLQARLGDAAGAAS